jgi:hypothetical protein
VNLGEEAGRRRGGGGGGRSKWDRISKKEPEMMSREEKWERY